MLLQPLVYRLVGGSACLAAFRAFSLRAKASDELSISSPPSWQVQTEGLVLVRSDSKASMTLLDRVSRVNGF
jgi:hypothetical protein